MDLKPEDVESMYHHEDGFVVYGTSDAIHKCMVKFARLRLFEAGLIQKVED